MSTERELSRLIDQYIKERRPAIKREARYFSHCSNLSSAIRKAALSVCECRRLHSHQRRNGHKVLALAERKLQASIQKISAAEAFEGIHSVVRSATKSVDRFGELAAYDVAYRIGLFQKKSPQKIYLHAGTLKGARGLHISGRAVDDRVLHGLCEAFRKLSVAEIENFLCVFKDPLNGKKLKPSRRSNNDCKVCGDPPN